MNTTVAKLISFVGLALVLLPCLLSFSEIVSLASVKWCALAGTILWFASSPLWLGRAPEVDDAEVQI